MESLSELKMKTCACCNRELSVEKFSIDRSRKDGLFKYCRECNSQKYLEVKDAKGEYQKAYRLRNIERHKKWSRKSRLKLTYNITEEQYSSMVEQQNNCCAICESVFTSKLKPQIDHDHDTGIVRGLLCRPCNTGIGLLKEDLKTLQSAKNYLAKDVLPLES